MSPPKPLTDRLLEQIQADPADPMPKLVLADLLEEHGEDRLAGAVRWCAEHGHWPERVIGFAGALSWLWWTCGIYFPHAVLPPDLVEPMHSNPSSGPHWSASTWQGALLLLAGALERLESQCPRP